MTPKENIFTTFEFTEAELIEAAKYTALQRAFIQHQIGTLYEDKNRLKLDPNNVVDFMQNESYISGQIAAYEYLLSCADATNQQLNVALSTQTQANQNRVTQSIFHDPNKLGE